MSRALVAAALLAICAMALAAQNTPMNKLAERYVKLVLAAGKERFQPVVGGAGQHHEIGVAIRIVERVIRLERHVDGARAALAAGPNWSLQ